LQRAQLAVANHRGICPTDMHCNRYPQQKAEDFAASIFHTYKEDENERDSWTAGNSTKNE